MNINDTNAKNDRRMLGMFPGLSIYGGIPASGLIAWEKMVETFNAPEHLYLFCYFKDQEIDQVVITVPAVLAATKLDAFLGAFSRRWPVESVLIWHLGLLKLLPFLRVFGAKVILFLHGVEIWKYRSLVDKLCLRQVDLFLSNSDFTWNQFVRANPSYVSAPHQTVHLGIGTPLAGSTPAPAATPIALMIGRLERNKGSKGHSEVISVWPAVVNRIPDAELWIVGGGELRGDLEQLVAARGLQKRVKFFGRVFEEKKQEALAQCRCLVLPSSTEGFGLVYLEAMRMGRPCLVSTIDAGREVISPPVAGLAANLDYENDLVESICELLQPGPRWDHWSINARRRYEAAFTAEHFKERLISAL